MKANHLTDAFGLVRRAHLGGWKSIYFHITPLWWYMYTPHSGPTSGSTDCAQKPIYISVPARDLIDPHPAVTTVRARQRPALQWRGELDRRTQVLQASRPPEPAAGWRSKPHWGCCGCNISPIVIIPLSSLCTLPVQVVSTPACGPLEVKTTLPVGLPWLQYLIIPLSS